MVFALFGLFAFFSGLCQPARDCLVPGNLEVLASQLPVDVSGCLNRPSNASISFSGSAIVLPSWPLLAP